MKIVFLGTSAAIPTLSRWTSSIAVFREGEVLLFDCGEGTQVQFLKAGLSPGKLSRIFISHFHGDHVYGLIGLLTTMQLNGREKTIHLYGPEGLQDYLEYMQKFSHFTFRYKIEYNEVKEFSEKAVWDCGEYAVTAMPLEHRAFALGYRLEEKPKPGKFNNEEAERLGVPSGPERNQLMQGQTLTLPDGTQVRPEQIIGQPRDGKKIAICMDTMPCENSIVLARNADLLIHEGTFENSKNELAQQTGHSTITQAAEIASKANAKQLILTHLSARYEKENSTELLKEAKKIFENTTIAVDLLEYNL